MMASLAKLPQEALAGLVVLLAAALAVALYGSYQRGKELDLVCDQIALPLVVGISGHPKSPKAAAEQICYERQTD